MTQALTQYDLVVIGSGPGGEVGAIRAAQLGFKVALVEKEPHLGGTCLNWGCIPTKALLEAARTYDKLKHVADLGFNIGNVEVQWSKILARKDGIVDQQRKGLRFLMKKNKIDTFEGHGRLTGKTSVSVRDKAGVEQILNTKFVLLATGSRVRELPFAPSNGKNILNSDHVLSIDSIPKSLAVIGGGVVGTEFASLFARMGSEVTVIELGAQILPSEDDEVVQEFLRAFKKQRVNVDVSTQVKSIVDKGNSVEVVCEGKPARSFEKVLVSVGRAPVTEAIGLDAVGLGTLKSGFIETDAHYRTKVGNIFAIGDILTTPALAHTASAEAMHAVEVMAGHHPPIIDYLCNPNAIYTYPEIASVGLTERALKQKGIDYKIAKFPFAPMAKAKIDGATEGFIKILFAPKFKEILGAHIINAKATELIAEFALGKVLETTLDEIGYTIHPHPTMSETIMEAAHAGMGGAIHL